MLDRNFDRIFKIFPYFFGLVFCLILLYWIGVGFLVYKSADAISKDGISGVVEKLWCGEKKDCKVPGL